MKAVADAISNASLAAFALLALVCLAQWRARRQAALGWATATFGSLGTVALAGWFLGEDAEVPDLVLKALLMLLFVFPYFMYRFTVSFEPASRRLEWLAGIATAVVVAVTMFMPHFPGRDEPRPAWVLAYSLLILLQWTVLFVVSAVRLWRAGRGQPTLARRRMRILALGSAGMNVAIVIGVATPQSRPPGFLLTSALLSLTTALLFFVGIAPPRALRVLWRQPEQNALGRAVSGLLSATTVDEVAATVLPHTAHILGARSVSLFAADGQAIASYGTGSDGGEEERRVKLRSGALVVRTSPYTPFFGREEYDLLDGLGAFTDLALERCATFAREREFIANAAHELRTPLAAMTGLSATLAEFRGRMTDEQLGECFEALDRQGVRAVTLVNSLLDLAHVDHTGVALTWTPLASSVAHAVAAAPPPEGTEVRTTVPDDLAVLAEAGRLEQVITNLLVNAYRYGGRHIDVDVRTGDDIVVMISDDGPGVPLDLVPKLFEPFTRARQSTTPGSGLGLAISRRLVHAFGGEIWYEPREHGGARFSFRLKRAA